MLAEILSEADRQDRSISWLIQQAWKIARSEMKKIPSTTDYIPDESWDGDDSSRDKA
jgi:uncharacterized small protein (TIGR04563 family)